MPMTRARLIAAAVLLLIVVFVAGYVPQNMEKRRLARDLETAEVDLTLANLHRQLGLAALAAQRDDFQTATVAARSFFEGCRETVYTRDFTGEPRTRVALGSYGAQGDAILLQLAAGDPAVKARLMSLYETMNGVLARRKDV